MLPRKGAPVVALCAQIESELADLDEEDKMAFFADIGLEEPGPESSDSRWL